MREQDRFLPIANISRIMKKALPGNAKIAKDAKETVQECVSEFISFITSEWVRHQQDHHQHRYQAAEAVRPAGAAIPLSKFLVQLPRPYLWLYHQHSCATSRHGRRQC